MKAQKVLIQRRLSRPRADKSQRRSQRKRSAWRRVGKHTEDSRLGLTNTVMTTSTSDDHSISDETGNRSGEAGDDELWVRQARSASATRGSGAFTSSYRLYSRVRGKQDPSFHYQSCRAPR